MSFVRLVAQKYAGRPRAKLILCLSILIWQPFGLLSCQCAIAQQATQSVGSDACPVSRVAVVPQLAQSLPTSKKATTVPAVARPALSLSAYEVASDMGLIPSFEQLDRAKQTTPNQSLEILRLKQDTLETILTASFEIRSALSRVERDLSRTNEVLNNMQERRDRNVQKGDIANFIQSGTTEVLSTSLADFTSRSGPLSIAGAVLGAIGGAGEIGISTYSLKLNKGPRRSAPAEPNMLSQLFDLGGPMTNYPPGVWNYLNDPNPRSPTEEPRRVRLIRQWVRLKRITDPTTAEGKRKIALIIGQVPQVKSVTIELLQDRVLMLSDLKAAISQMDQEMLEIMRWLQYH